MKNTYGFVGEDVIDSDAAGIYFGHIFSEGIDGE